MRTQRRRPLAIALSLAAGAALTLGACSGDDDGGSTDAFCEEISKLAESSGDTTEAEDLAALQAVADAAPTAISDEMNELISGFEQLQAFDPETSTEEEMADFLAIADSLDQASGQVEEYATENCPDLPPELFNDG